MPRPAPSALLTTAPRLTLAALQVLAGAGVDADAVAGVDEQGHLDLRARLQNGGLGDVGSGVALDAGVRLGDLQLHKVRRLHAEHAALVGHDFAGHVLLDKLEVVPQDILVDGGHLIALHIHEIVQVSVIVAVLHVLAIHKGLLKLGGGVEGGLSDGAGDDVSHLGAHKGCALAGLDVLELHHLHHFAFH